MRFDTIKARGIGPFRDELSLDFTKVAGPLVAITGGNGEGKSTLLELLAGGLFRSCPTRGSLAGLAVSRDAFVEIGIVNGASHTIRHSIDNVSGKGESLVLNAAGAPELSSAKVREFDEWATMHLPSPAVLYASTFAAQGSSGFMELKPGDRKAVLLRLLGIEQLEAKAERARAQARSVRTGLEVLRARIADEQARGGNVVDAEARLEEAKTRAMSLDTQVLVARKAADDAKAALEAYRETERIADEARAKCAELDRRLATTAETTKDMETRLANNRAVLTEGPAIRAAHARLATIDGRLGELREAKSSSAVAWKGAQESHDKLVLDHKNAVARFEAAQRRVTAAEARVAKRDEVEAAEKSLPGLRDALDEAEKAVEVATAEVRRVQGLALGGAETRIKSLRASLEQIGGACSNAQDMSLGLDLVGELGAIEDLAANALDADAAIAGHADRAPELLRAASARETATRGHAGGVRAQLSGAEARAARMGEIEAALAEAKAATKDVAKAAEDIAALERGIAVASVEVDALLNLNAPMLAETTALTEERARVAPLAGKLERLTAAEGRIAELEPRVEAGQAELALLKKERDAVVVPSLPAIDRDALTRATASVGQVETSQRLAHGELAKAEAALTTARESSARLDEQLIAQRDAEEDLSDWTRLADDLGRDGLQALEVDAAFPELTTMVNDLLHTCFGPRWTVSIEASRLSADGKKQLEGCEVRVLDTERGRDGTAESLSGGERVIVGEAISLALSMLACRRSGVQGATLVRDETGAALDAQNARAFVSMLRRAAELVGASKVLFVSHSADVVDLADARIEIKNGKATVMA